MGRAQDDADRHRGHPSPAAPVRPTAPPNHRIAACAWKREVREKVKEGVCGARGLRTPERRADHVAKELGWYASAYAYCFIL